MKIYVTFGQIHKHKLNGITFDKDSIAAIECKNFTEGRMKAFELFGREFFTTYESISDEDLSFFPRGIIEVERKHNET